jgi:PP-loop superfamily ATP-utilizing enzyme
MTVLERTGFTLDAAFRDYGYVYVTIDLRGFRSGSMNEVIAFGRLQPPVLP